MDTLPNDIKLIIYNYIHRDLYYVVIDQLIENTQLLLSHLNLYYARPICVSPFDDSAVIYSYCKECELWEFYDIPFFNRICPSCTNEIIEKQMFN